MEETQQVPTQNPITPAPPIVTYPMSQPAPISKTPWILITLIVALLGVASYFGYQNYQLKQRLTIQQPTPTPTVVASSPTGTSASIPTTNPTENWKTYTNTVYGYSIKYPKDWFAYDKGIEMTKGDFRDPKKMVLISQKEIDTVPEGDAYFSGAMLIFADIGKVDKANIDRNTFKVEETSLAGRQALKVYAIGELIMGKPQTNYYVGEDYQDFSISFENTDLNGSHDKIFDQILSTLKFTK